MIYICTLALGTAENKPYTVHQQAAVKYLNPKRSFAYKFPHLAPVQNHQENWRQWDSIHYF